MTRLALAGLVVVALMGCGSPTEPEGMKIKVTYIYCNQDGTVCRDTTEWR